MNQTLQLCNVKRTPLPPLKNQECPIELFTNALKNQVCNIELFTNALKNQVCNIELYTSALKNRVCNNRALYECFEKASVQ